MDKSPALKKVYEQDYPTGIDCSAVDELLKSLQGDLVSVKKILSKHLDFRQRSNPQNKFRNPDYYRHGTAVVICLLTVAPKARVTVIKLPDRHVGGEVEEAFKHALTLKPNIISVSLAKYVCSSYVFQDAFADSVAKTIDMSCLVLFGTGNNEAEGLVKNGKSKINARTQIESVIAVGGAYHESNDATEFTASNFAHGYPAGYGGNDSVRKVPDICGLCGPKEEGEKKTYFRIPWHALVDQGEFDSRWQTGNGTSYSTPQVAGVCALMQQKFPRISYDKAKEILQKTAKPVKLGQTAQEHSLAKLKAGVVNIEAAVEMAGVEHYKEGAKMIQNN